MVGTYMNRAIFKGLSRVVIASALSVLSSSLRSPHSQLTPDTIQYNFKERKRRRMHQDDVANNLEPRIRGRMAQMSREKAIECRERAKRKVHRWETGKSQHPTRSMF